MSDLSNLKDLLIRLISEAAASKEGEGSRGRTGAFSYSAETHAAGIGFGVGLAASVTENYRYVGALLTILFEVNRENNTDTLEIANDLLKEPHYAIGGLSAGLIVGSIGGSRSRVRSGDCD